MGVACAEGANFTVQTSAPVYRAFGAPNAPIRLAAQSRYRDDLSQP
jgi:hypothetical protein